MSPSKLIIILIPVQLAFCVKHLDLTKETLSGDYILEFKLLRNNHNINEWLGIILGTSLHKRMCLKNSSALVDHQLTDQNSFDKNHLEFLYL